MSTTRRILFTVPDDDLSGLPAGQYLVTYDAVDLNSTPIDGQLQHAELAYRRESHEVWGPPARKAEKR